MIVLRLRDIFIYFITLMLVFNNLFNKGEQLNEYDTKLLNRVEGDCFDLDEQSNLLRSLVLTISTRITYAKDVARYKWYTGKPILDEARESAILQNVSDMAAKLSVPYWPELRSFFKELMEATKLVEYILFSEWYYKKVNSSAGLETPARMVDLNVTRQIISGMQRDIIIYFSRLSDLRDAELCDTLVAKAIKESKCVNKITERGIVRAFGTFCNKHKRHLKPNLY